MQASSSLYKRRQPADRLIRCSDVTACQKLSVVYVRITVYTHRLYSCAVYPCYRLLYTVAMEIDNSYSEYEVANCHHMFELETRLIMETVSKWFVLCCTSLAARADGHSTV